MTHELTRREALKGAAAVTAAAALAPLAAPAAAAPVPPLPVIEERLPITLICRRPAHFDPVGDPEEVQAAWDDWLQQYAKEYERRWGSNRQQEAPEDMP